MVKLQYYVIDFVSLIFISIQLFFVQGSQQQPAELERKLTQLENEILPKLYDEKNVKVPRIVFQIWLGVTSPAPELQYARSCYQLNPHYEFSLFDADLVQYFLNTRLPPELEELKQVYDDLQNYGEKSDLIRYLLLYKYGGIYTDLDVQCLRPFDGSTEHENLRNISDLVIPLEGDFPVQMQSSVPIAKIRQASQFILFASPGGHPVLKKAIQRVQETTNKVLQESDFLDVLYRTGPGMLTDVAIEHFNTDSKWTVALMPIVKFNQKMGFGLPGFSPLAAATHTTAFHKWTKSGEFSTQNISRPSSLYQTQGVFKSKLYQAQPVWIGGGNLLVPLMGQLKTSYGRDVGEILVKYGVWPAYHDLSTATSSLTVEFLKQFVQTQQRYGDSYDFNILCMGGDGAGYLPIKMALNGWKSTVYIQNSKKQLAKLIRKSAQLNSLKDRVGVKILEDDEITSEFLSISIAKIAYDVVHFGELISDMETDEFKDFFAAFVSDRPPKILIAELDPKLHGDLLPTIFTQSTNRGYKIYHAGFVCEKRSVYGVAAEEFPISPVELSVAGQRICSINNVNMWSVVKMLQKETTFPEILIFSSAQRQTLYK